MLRIRVSHRSPSIGPFIAACLALCSVAGAQTPTLEASADSNDHVKIVESADSSLRIAVREALIGSADPRMVMPEQILSPNGKSLAYLIGSGGALTVVYDGLEGEPYQGISDDSIQFSPDGEHLVYIGKRGNSFDVVVDGVAYPNAAVASPGVVFSPDSQRVAWAARNSDHTMHAVVDGELGAEFDGIGSRGVVFSADSSQFAYVASHDGKQSLVRNEEPGTFYDDILAFWWSPSGARLGYVANDGDTSVVVYEGEVLARVDEFGADGFVFPKMGDRYAISLFSAERWSVLVDGERSGDYSRVAPGMTFSPDGSRFAYMAGGEDGMTLVIDGTPLEESRTLEALTFSPFGKHLALVVLTAGQRHVMVNGKAEQSFDSIERPGVTFSPDGRHYFYEGRTGKRRSIVYDSKPGPSFTRFGSVQPSFDSNGAFAYSIRKQGNEIVVVNGRVEETFERVRGFVFSPDGEHYAYFGKRANLWHFVRDGKTGDAYEKTVSSPVLSFDGSRFGFIIVHDAKGHVVIDGVEGPGFDYVMPGSVAFTPDGKHSAYISASADRRFIVIDELLIENDYDGFFRESGIGFDDERHLFVKAGRRGFWILVELEIL